MKKMRFTLIEILCVVGLISLLAALGFAGYSYAMNAAKESATRSLILRIDTALKSVQNKFGVTPVCNDEYKRIIIYVEDNGLITKIKFGANDVPTQDSDWTWTKTTNEKILKEFLGVVDGESLKKFLDADGKLEDSWGEAIYYRYPGKVNTTSFDIISGGSDGLFGKDEGLPPEKVEDIVGRETFIDSANEWLCDDIANF